MKKQLYGFALAALAGGLLASCSNDLNEPTFGPVDGNSTVNLVHAPDVYAWSGDEVFGDNTRAFGTRADEESATKPPRMTGDEIAKVSATFNNIDNYFSGESMELPEGVTLYNGFDDFSNTWLQNGSDFYVVNVGNVFSYDNDAPLVNIPLRFWHQEHGDNISEDTYNNSDNYTELDYAETLFSEEDNPQKQLEKNIKDISFNEYATFICAKHPLYTNANSDYNAFPNNPPFRYVTIDGMSEGKDWEYVYIGCYWQESDKSHNSGGSVTGDNKWDRIIRIAKSKHPKISEGEEVCDVCGHPAHKDGSCKVCDQFKGCNDKYYRIGTDEVEVNLSINDVHRTLDNQGTDVQKYKNADLWTKLSIHVRKGTNVEIKIPLAGIYLVESDDLAIVQKHFENMSLYEGDPNEGHISSSNNEDMDLEGLYSKHSITYPLYDTSVTLTVEITLNEIIVTTKDIDQDLINKLYRDNGDGINFEVWFYFQTETAEWLEKGDNESYPNGGHIVSGTLDKELSDKAFYGIKEKLDNSTIKFEPYKLPAYYINAFNAVGMKIEDGEITNYGRKFDQDCTVSIIGGQRESYEADVIVGPHLNASWFNEIYKKTDSKPYPPFENIN